MKKNKKGDIVYIKIIPSDFNFNKISECVAFFVSETKTNFQIAFSESKEEYSDVYTVEKNEILEIKTLKKSKFYF